MVWASINEKSRHLIKIFISYVSFELNVSNIIKISVIYTTVISLILLSIFI